MWNISVLSTSCMLSLLMARVLRDSFLESFLGRLGRRSVSDTFFTFLRESPAGFKIPLAFSVVTSWAPAVLSTVSCSDPVVEFGCLV